MTAAHPDARFGTGAQLGIALGEVLARRAAWVAAAGELTRAARGPGLERAVELACRQGFALRRGQALDAGVSDATLRRLLRGGQWASPRYGVVSPLPYDMSEEETSAPAGRSSLKPTQPCGAAMQVAAAAAALVRPDCFVSHESAMAMHGLPTLATPARPTLCAVAQNQVAGRRDILVRTAGIRPEELTSWFGVPVTTVARTVIDVTRNAGVAAGLVTADVALGAGLVTSAELTQAREYARYRPGVRDADRVLDLADAASESPLESLTRLCLVEGGLPAPELQQWIDTSRGSYRVDLLYRHRKVIVEADGVVRYRAGGDALIAEKLRQEALERAGYIVVRVLWTDVMRTPWEVVARVRFALGRPRPHNSWSQITN